MSAPVTRVEASTPPTCPHCAELKAANDILVDALVQSRKRLRGPLGAMKALGRDRAIELINDALEQAGHADKVAP
jgi:hypothetical protein